MANTDITLTSDGGIIVPSTPSVHVASGDTLSFATSDGSPVVLFFSPDATSILTPAPASAFPIAAHGKAAFTFSSSKPGAYSVFFGVSSSSAPSSFPQRISQDLLLEISTSSDTPPPFGGPGDVIKTGS
jgi:hypothetical protein